MGLYMLGGLAAVLALWFMVQAADGLGYAFPRRPTIVDPSRGRTSATILIFLIIAGLIASLVVPFAAGQNVGVSFYHLLIAAAVLLPAWELMTADVYKGSFVIVNAIEETTRPALVAAINEVFGTVIEDHNSLVAADWEGDDFLLLIDERLHLIVVNPTFSVPAHKVYLLMKVLHDKLKDVKAPRFNERTFWFAFVLPVALMAMYAAIAYVLLNPAAGTHPILLRGTVG